MTTITPNADQQVALDKIEKWLKSDSQTFSLGGLAGTGKSTIIPLIASGEVSVTIATPTGKAAAVVNQKFGKKVAKTIHQLAYAPLGNRLTDRKDFLGRDEYEPVFEESEFYTPVCIVDEASMVSDDVYARLLKTGGKFLFIGDHGQLPPVKHHTISKALQYRDHTLTQIVRQAEDSPIRQMAWGVRQGAMLDHFDSCGAVTQHRVAWLRDVAQFCFDNNVQFIVAGTNKVRNVMNHSMRQLHGLGDAPMFAVGERIITTSNSHPKEIFNGETYTIVKVHGRQTEEEGEVITADITDGENTKYQVPLGFQWRTAFCYEAGVIGADLGYCLTCHKAQGSQADRVAVINENIGWMKEHAPAWRYTAVTRAAKQLDVFTLA